MKFKKTLVMRERKFKSTILALLFMAPILLSAQDSAVVEIKKPRIHEVGLALPNLSILGQVGLIYRVGNEKALWRFGAFSFTGSKVDGRSDSTRDLESEGFSAKITAGREYRKKLAEKLEFRYGTDLSFAFTTQKSRTESTIYDPNSDEFLYTTKSQNNVTSYTPGVVIVLGFNYNLSNKIILGAEIKPSVRYNYRENKRQSVIITETESQNQEDLQTSNGLSYGFSNNSVLLSIVYQF